MVCRANTHRLALRERLYAEPYYRAGVRRGRRAAGIGDRPLRRAMRRADRHRRDGAAQAADSRGRAAGARVRDAALQERRRARGSSRACRPTSRLPRAGSAMPAAVIEGGLRFRVPLAEGQKTGWFFDQAANRRALTKYVREGARVLDVFSYVGAWGVRAARDGRAARYSASTARRPRSSWRQERRAQLAEARDAQGRRVRGARGARAGARAIRHRDRRSARPSPSARRICRRRWRPTSA